MNLFDQYPLRTLLQSVEPYALSPVLNSHPTPKGSRWASLTGLTRVPGLGLLTTNVTAKMNAAIVFRTWGLTKQEPSLQPEFYGPNFTYREFMYAHGVMRGFLTHYAVLVGAMLILVPPFRSLLKRLFKPGEGPDKDKAQKETIEFRAVATPDVDTKTDKQVFGKLSYSGSMYFRKLEEPEAFCPDPKYQGPDSSNSNALPVTAALIAQAAKTMLEDDIGRLTGGVYTPACLGQKYVDRLQDVGVKFEIEVRTL
jgi:short subunit dehydrogenase-like uncharacterized protein